MTAMNIALYKNGKNRNIKILFKKMAASGTIFETIFGISIHNYLRISSHYAFNKNLVDHCYLSSISVTDLCGVCYSNKLKRPL